MLEGQSECFLVNVEANVSADFFDDRNKEVVLD